MTVDQLTALLRQVLPIVGTLLTVFGMSSATANSIVNLIMTISGPIMAVASALWAFFANSKASIISSAAAMPEVQSIKLEPSAPNSVLQATPSNVNK